VLGVVLAVFVVKLLTTGTGLLALGYGAGTAVSAAVLLGQVGEFSFVLERAGRTAGLFPGGLESGGPETFIAATVVLMIVTPFLSSVGKTFGTRRRDRSPDDLGEGPDSLPPHDHHSEFRDHLIIAGLGEAASRLSHVLDRSCPTSSSP
jgi:CPA2 family monovalent cation:H+ antiporter-2